MPSIIQRDIERWTFQVYVTDTLRVIAENTAATAVLADKFVEFREPVGKSVARRWIERDKPAPPEETRTADEVIEHIRGKLASL